MQASDIIKIYEEEKTRLEALIKACLENFEGPDYLSAHCYQKALNKVGYTLRKINELEYNNFNQKIIYQKRIESIEKFIEVSDNESMKMRLFDQLQLFKEKHEVLNAMVTSAESKTNEGILDKALADLISKKIKKFKIIFNKSEGISLELSAKGQVIKIVSSVIKKDDIYNIQLPLLQKLGFELTKQNKLICQFKNLDDSALIKLKFLLTRIVFDVYYFRHPANENFIEF